jgi:hypothetical protein
MAGCGGRRGRADLDVLFLSTWFMRLALETETSRATQSGARPTRSHFDTDLRMVGDAGWRVQLANSRTTIAPRRGRDDRGIALALQPSMTTLALGHQSLITRTNLVGSYT